MRPTPADPERELLLTVARVLRSMIDNPTHGADDHLYLAALDRALKPFEKSGSSGRGDAAPEDDGNSNRPACRFGDAAS